MVKGQASFASCAIFLLPEEQTVSCYGCLLNRFRARGWVARELRTQLIGEFMDLVDDLRNSYINDDGHGSTVGDIVTILCGCPEVCRKEKTLVMFRLNCLCIGLFPPISPSVRFGSFVSPSGGPELSKK